MIREGLHQMHQIWNRTACWSITAFDLPTQVSSKRQDHLSLIADDVTRYRAPKVLKLSSVHRQGAKNAKGHHKNHS